MNLEIPRLRMFAGPNGSGKSTIKDVISKELLGVYINPDEIEKEIKEFDFIDFNHYQITTSKDEVLDFFQNSTLLKSANLEDEIKFLKYSDDKLIFSDIRVNSYFASICADFIRKKLLEARKSFTFETVMSSYDKVELLELSKKLGYRNYLYYIATSDPLINISRVKNRVAFKGHDVPKDKIINRYYRSLGYLKDAVKLSHRAYIFDNSSNEKTWICEITNGSKVDMKVDTIPKWVKEYLL
ncbi:zeta toxin family protein [Aliarcobacter butzleri]|uniref:zeta toxin family protein n=1 Tax=Aliarcobacter butzleri TaxID=28197 RepID=UPI003B22268F